MPPEAIAYIILGVILVATFIAFFFFTYVSKVEVDVIRSQMNLIVTDLASGTGLIMTPEQKHTFGRVIQQNLRLPDMTAEDASAAKSNTTLQQKAIHIFGTIICIGIITIGLLWYRYKFDMINILKYSLIILLLVGITEFTFVTAISKNYQLVDPNYVKYLISSALLKYSQSDPSDICPQ